MAVKIIAHPEQRAIPSGDMPHFVSTYHRAVAMQEDHAGPNIKCEIHLGIRGTDRSSPEWLEHRIHVLREDGSIYMVIGAIERYEGASPEFCS